jgi:hypothetical protein
MASGEIKFAIVSLKKQLVSSADNARLCPHLALFGDWFDLNPQRMDKKGRGKIPGL